MKKTIGVALVLAVIACIHLICSNSLLAASEKTLKDQWVSTVCTDLGCMSLASTNYGVNLTAQGMVQDKSVLEGYGFKFGEGPYRVAATRIDTARYLISLQAMSRPGDRQEKEIRLKTRGDEIFPVKIPKSPEGKYTWNSAIQYDMGAQLGVFPSYEYDIEPLSFVDIVIRDPERLARAGFVGFQKNDTSCQLVYQGNNRWRLNPNGGALVYQNAKWSTVKTATAVPITHETKMDKPGPKASVVPSVPTVSDRKDVLVFVPVAATEMTYNKKSFKWAVFKSQTADTIYYLVRNPDIGTALIDIGKNAMFNAESAKDLPGGKGMSMDLNDLTLLDDSGAARTVVNSKEMIHAWWSGELLSFTCGDVALAQTPQVVTAQEMPASTIPASPQADAAEQKPLPDSTLLFANSDFEMGDLTNWTSEGDAFAFQPTRGDNPTTRGRKAMPSQHQGDFWIGTFEKYQGNSQERPGTPQGDRPTGSLTSALFEITADKISFLIGGGRNKDKESVSLVVAGQEVLSETGTNNETLTQKVWNVSAYKGKKAQIVIRDSHKGGWGHINADDFRYAGINPQVKQLR